MKLAYLIDLTMCEDVSVSLTEKAGGYPGTLKPLDTVDRETVKIKPLFSTRLLPKLRRLFGPKNIEFFKFYQNLRLMELGVMDIPSDLADQYKSTLRTFIRKSRSGTRKLSPPTLNMLQESINGTLRQRLKMVQRGNVAPRSVFWKDVAKEYANLIVSVTRDRGMYLNGRPTAGAIYWTRFIRMKAREEEIARLQDSDPEAYAAVGRYKRTLKDIDAEIQTQASRDGRKVVKKPIHNKIVNTAVDPVTKETWVYDHDGEVLLADDFKVKLALRREQKARATSNKLTADTVRRVDAAVVDAAVEAKAAEGRELTRMAITDDEAKSDGLTRVFPVVEVLNVSNPEAPPMKVVASGRFKGASIDDLVSENGRMIEGTTWTYSRSRGAQRGRPVRRDMMDAEPYVTVTKENPPRLLLRLPKGDVRSGKGEATALRQAINGGVRTREDGTKYAVKGLNSLIAPPGLEKLTGGGSMTYALTADNYAVVADALGSLALSEGAKKMVEDYFDEMTRADQATNEENLKSYAPEALSTEYPVFDEELGETVQRESGFKDGVRFNSAQMKSLAWLEANGDSGVVSLDTGVGKTLVAVAAMQKMVRDGTQDDPDNNGRFLFVSPGRLKGAVITEAKDFLSEHARDFLIDRIDTLNYKQFSGAVARGIVKIKSKQHELAKYVAIFFDEAQALTNTNSPITRRLLAFNHPRKICLTASPMESEPMDAYVLAAISNNDNITAGMVLKEGNPRTGKLDKRRRWTDAEVEEGKAARARMRRFKDRFVERVGGRAVGVKGDPVTRQDMDTWVKRNIFFEDKADVWYPKIGTEDEIFQLPELEKRAIPVQMDPSVEKEYRNIVKSIRSVQQQMVKQFRDLKGSKGKQKLSKAEKEMRKFTTKKMKEEFQRLHVLANRPEDYADLMKKLNKGRVERGEKPHGVVSLAGKDGKVHSAKREVAAHIIKTKIDRSLKKGGTKAKTIFWTDDAVLAKKHARNMSEDVKGVIHAAGTSKGVWLYRNGKEETSYTFKRDDWQFTHPLPISVKSNQGHQKLKPNLDLAPNNTYNTSFAKDSWATFAMKEIVNKDPDIVTVTLVGGKGGYSTGQNLQSFTSVIHLDRDTWNSEDMKQRDARAWRQGQKSPVDSLTLDVRYSEVENDLDRTIDEVRRYQQEMEQGLFNDIIKKSQEAALGQQWTGVDKRHASYMKLDDKTQELMMSPYLTQETP